MRRGPPLPLAPTLARLGLLGAALSAAGCGLTLDYDPPGDAGADAPFDAARLDAPVLDAPVEADAGEPCGGCPAGSRCVGSVCRAACDDTTPCADPLVCEACVGGACLPVDLSCSGGSACLSGACDPATDACAYQDTCGPGLACSSGSCVPGTCTSDADCEGIVGGCGYVCAMGACVPRMPPICPTPILPRCEVLDPCTCEGTGVASDALCGGAGVCDVESFLCVACVTDLDCDPTGPGRCDPRTRTCVECVHDGDCGATLRCDPGTRSCVDCLEGGDCEHPTPACDPYTHACVECTRDADCESGLRCDARTRICVGCLDGLGCPPSAPICDPTTRRCRPCTAGSTGECDPGERCELGACVPAGCAGPSDCPLFGCAGTVACTAGTGGGNRCVYSDLNAGACDDGVPCTIDACDPGRATDASGCVHTPRADACADAYSCTIDVCHVATGPGDRSGCRHIPDDGACGSGPSTDCAQRVCVAGEPGAIVETSTGCGLTYLPYACAPGTYCTPAGRCVPLPTCSLGTPCPAAGSPCLDPLVCVGSRCQPLDLGLLDPCDATSTCGTYCSTTGCALRTLGLACGPVALP